MTEQGFNATAVAGTVRLSGELDMATAPDLEPILHDLIASGGPVVLDLRELRFMDSSGIGLVVKTAKALPHSCVVIHGAQGGVAKVLEMTGIGAAENIHVLPCTVSPGA